MTALPVERADLREVLRLALPATASGLVALGYHWTDWWWVGRLHDTSVVAALSVATFAVWALFAATALVAVGAMAVVGRYAGGGRDAAARYVGSQALRWSAALAVAVGAIGFALAPVVFDVAGASPAAAAAGVPYVRVFCLAGLSIFPLAACDAVWRGHGDTRVPFLVASGGLLANAALDPLLIFGAGPVPALGVLGAAIATAVCNGGALAVSVALLRRRGFLDTRRPSDDEMRLAPTTRLSRGPPRALDLAVGVRLGRVGLPTCVAGVSFVAIYLALAGIVARAGGDAAQAGLGVGLRAEQVAFVLGQGCAAAAAVVVARGLGAGDPDRAARGAWRATGLCSAACLAYGALLFLAARPLAEAFVPGDPAAQAHAVSYCRWVAPCLALQACEVVTEGAFAGAGFTVPPMIVSIALTGARIPLAWHFAITAGGGATAIWIVISATAAARGVVLLAWFRRGTWRTRTV